MPLSLSYRFALASAAVSALLFSIPVQAQVAGDGTLGTQVNGNLTAPCTGFCTITNGATRGSNLFHSFRQFSLPNGDFAAFITNPAIQNVIVRVTGVGQPFISNINGSIATTDPTFTNLIPTNFFLLNPNGIVFGSNAQIFVGGSFLASTAERMLFQDGTVFDTRDQTVAPLLTVSVPVGLQFGQTPGTIQSRMRIAAVINSLFTDFALIGGDVTLDNTIIVAPGRRVELGSIAGAGTVGLTTTANGLRLDFPDGLPRGDASIINGSIVNVLGINGGSLAVTARKLDISGGSRLTAGISSRLGFTGSQAGDVTLNATDILTLRQTSSINNVVQTGAIGNAGNLLISTGSISVTEGSQLNASTFGTGNAGNVIINARDRILFSGNNSVAFSNVGDVDQQTIPQGNGGNVKISTGILEVLNGAQIVANTFGIGNAGNVIIDIFDRVLFSGNALVASTVGGANQSTVPQGNGGNLQISTPRLEILNGAQLLSGTLGIGDAGNVMINARDRVLFSGNAVVASSVGSANQPTIPKGNGGNIEISTGTLEITNGSQMFSSTLGIGNAGSVIINARDRVLFNSNSSAASSVGSANQPTIPKGNGGNIEISTGTLEITNDSKLSATTFGIGNAGSVIINARNHVLFSSNSNAFSSVGAANQRTVPQGNGGNVQISTGTLEITNGAALVVNTLGIGDAGDVMINARDRVLFNGNSSAFSGVGSANQPTIPKGNGGNIEISTGTLEITNRSQLASSTLGIGDAGNVMINVRDRVLFNNGFVLSSVGSVNQPTIPKGNGGNIEISTGILEVLNGSQLNASTFGTGNAGDVIIDARDQVSINGTSADRQSRTGIFVSSQTFSGGAGNLTIATPQLRLDDRGLMSAQSATGDGGNITLNVRDLLLMRRGSQISTTAGNEQFGGDGGNITINAPKGFIVGVKGENSDITANAFTGSGGRVNITAQGIYGLQFRPKLTEFSDITASSTFGVSGVVAINTLGIDPSRGLQQLPVGLVDPSNRIDQKCAAGSGFRRSSFTVTGRGGLPENPLEPLQSGEGIASWVEVGTENTQPSTLTPLADSSTPPPSTPSLLVEADTVMVGKNGSVQLVASQPLAEPGGFWYLPSCASLKESDR